MRGGRSACATRGGCRRGGRARGPGACRKTSFRKRASPFLRLRFFACPGAKAPMTARLFVGRRRRSGGKTRSGDSPVFCEGPTSIRPRVGEFCAASILQLHTTTCAPHGRCRGHAQNMMATPVSKVLKRRAAHDVHPVLPCGCDGHGFNGRRLLGTWQHHDQHGLQHGLRACRAMSTARVHGVCDGCALRP